MLATHLLDTLPLIIREWRTEIDGNLPEGLSAAQFRVLWFIQEGHHQCGLLSRRLGVSPAAMSKSIDALVKGGFVSRTPSEVDRRQVGLALTRKGVSVSKRVRVQIEKRMQTFLENLTQNEKQQVETALRLMRKAFTAKR